MEEILEEKLEAKLNKKFEEGLRPINERLDRLESTTSKLNDDITYVRVVLLENDIIPRLNTIEKCYVETSKRYMKSMEVLPVMQADVDNLKITVQKHSELLSRIS